MHIKVFFHGQINCNKLSIHARLKKNPVKWKTYFPCVPKNRKHKNEIVNMNFVNMFLSSGFLCKIAILVKSISIQSAKQLTETSVIACVNLRYCKLKSSFKKKNNNKRKGSEKVSFHRMEPKESLFEPFPFLFIGFRNNFQSECSAHLFFQEEWNEVWSNLKSPRFYLLNFFKKIFSH